MIVAWRIGSLDEMAAVRRKAQGAGVCDGVSYQVRCCVSFRQGACVGEAHHP